MHITYYTIKFNKSPGEGNKASWLIVLLITTDFMIARAHRKRENINNTERSWTLAKVHVYHNSQNPTQPLRLHCHQCCCMCVCVCGTQRPHMLAQTCLHVCIWPGPAELLGMVHSIIIIIIICLTHCLIHFLLWWYFSILSLCYCTLPQHITA